jgi:glycerophosphoryl diester phosphodiesterase
MSDMSQTLVIAHRGASADHLENTREAFIGAARQGADWVELDVRHTVDGSLIVNHDPWYRNGRLVWSTSLEERPEEVLDLEAALDACCEERNARGFTMGVNVEIKNTPGDLGSEEVPRSLEVADAVLEKLSARRRSGIVEEILISSFDPETLDRVRALGGPPTAQLVLDVSSWPELIVSTADRGHGFIHPWDPFVDKAFIDEAHAAGLRVNTWTVDDRDRIQSLVSMEVDGVVTNVPSVARSVMQG